MTARVSLRGAGSISAPQIYHAGPLGESDVQNDDRMNTPTMTWHYEIKEFYDYSEDIEGVNIHYLCTPLGGVPDWENQRVTRFMPRVQPSPSLGSEVPIGRIGGATAPTTLRLRRKILKLPQQIPDPQSGRSTDRYLLHHYFEIFQDGHRQYSPLYTEELYTKAATQPTADETVSEKQDTAVASFTQTVMKESKG